MGFLDSKTRIFDVVLTDKGRELLSQNLLDFEFYAFSDEGVDYSGALTASLEESGSVDDYIRRTLTFEATQRKDFKEQRDMNTFLYTIPSRRRTLPQFITNFDDTSDITLKRSYFMDKLVLRAERQGDRLEDPVAVVMQAAVPKQDMQAQMEKYAVEQQAALTQQRIVEGQNVVGMPISENQIMLNSRQMLNTENGAVESLGNYKPPNSNDLSALTVSDDIEVVTGLSRGVIHLSLKSSEGAVPSPNGYLVEVYESGSDGRIIKLFEEDVIDALEDNVLKKGFDSDLFIDVDVTNAKLISEERRLARREVRRQEAALRRLQKELRRKLRG